MTEPLSLVFLPASGAASDAELLAELTARLAPDVRDGRFRIAGSPPATGLCVLLLPASPDLVGQRSLWDAALAAGREHERRGVAQLIVLHLKPHDGGAAVPADLVKLPADGRAITEWPRREAAWDDVVRCLRAIAVRGYLVPPRPATPPPAAPILVGEAPSLAGAPPPAEPVASSPPEEAPFHIPVPRDPSLIGREATIAEIAGRFHPRDPASPATPLVLLHGPAGAGQTAVLVEYAHRYRSAYPGGVFWIDVSTGEEGYRAIVAQLGLRERSSIGMAPWPMELPQAFSRRTGWLLLIDTGGGRSLEARMLVSGFSGSPHGGRVLVAASEDLGRGGSSAATIELPPLDETSGAAILCAAAERPVPSAASEVEAAAAVAGALGGDLVAIQLAGAYLAAYPEVSFKAYLELLTAAPVASDDEEQAGIGRATTAPERAFAESWRVLTPAARDVFRLLVASRRERFSLRRLTLLARLDSEAMLAATAQLRRLRFLDEEPLPTVLQVREGVAALARDTVGNSYPFARDRADALLIELEDLGMLQREIAAGGAAVLLAELRSISSPHHWKRRTALRWLDAAPGSLAGWDPESDPDRVLVQLRDWAFDAGLSDLQLRAERALQAGARPWLRRRTATSPSPGRVLGTHDGPVTTVLLSPEGRLALSGSEDGTARCWDLERNKVVELRGHRGPVRALALALDARLAITGSDDGTLKVWELPSGAERFTLEWHIAAVRSVAISRDGLRAVSSARDGYLYLWDLADGAPIGTWYATSTSGAVVTALLATPDDARLVVVWSDGQMRWLRVDEESWSDSNILADGAPVHLAAIAGILTGAVRGMAVDERRAIAVTPSPEHDLVVWDFASGELRSALAGHTGSILCAALSPDGERAISGSADWTVRLWDIARGTLPMSGDRLVSTAMIQGDRRTVALTVEGALTLWDTATGRLLRTLQTLPRGQRGSRFMTALPGSRVLVTNPGRLEIWDVDEGRRVASIEAPWDQVGSVVASATGHRAAVTARPKAGRARDLKLFLLDLETGAGAGEPVDDAPARGLALLDGDRILVTDPRAGTVRCVNIATGATIQSFAVPGLTPGPIVAAPRGRRMVCTTARAVVVVDLDSGEPVLTIPIVAPGNSRSSRGPCMAVTPDGRLLGLATETHELSPHVSASEVALHEIPSGRVVARLVVPFMPDDCALSADGSTVVLGASPRLRRKVQRRRGDGSNEGWFTEVLETQPRVYFVDYVR